VEFRIDAFEISHVDRLAKDLFVERSAEVGIQESATALSVSCDRYIPGYSLKDRLSDDPSNELEERQVVVDDR
jgi:hypothetical protein